MRRLNHWVMAPATVSIESECIHLQDPDIAAMPGRHELIPLKRISCVLMKQYDLEQRRFYFADAASVRADSEGHLIIFQGMAIRWELHFFRCDTEAGYVYQTLQKYLPESVFGFKDEHDYMALEEESSKAT